MFVQEVESTLRVSVAVIQGEKRKYDVKLLNSRVPSDLKNDPENVAASTRRNDMSKKRTKPDIGQHETRFRKGGRINFICRPYSFKLIHMVLMWVFIQKSNAQNTAIPIIVTSPIVYGENMTFKCLYNDSTYSSSLSTRWLKGQDKVPIAYGNSSTNETKYSSSLKNEGSRYIYLLTVHRVSFTDLRTYVCEFGFQYAILQLTIQNNLSFIYIPNKRDIVFNITETKPIKIKIFIRKVFPPPKCAVFYQKEDITNKINSTVKIEGTLYSIEMGMTLHDCSGNLNISCLVDSRHFTTSVDIQQCCEGTECYPKHGFKFWTIVLIPVVMILFILVVWLCQKSRKNDTLQDPLQQNNLLDEF